MLWCLLLETFSESMSGNLLNSNWEKCKGTVCLILQLQQLIQEPTQTDTKLLGFFFFFLRKKTDMIFWESLLPWLICLVFKDYGHWRQKGMTASSSDMGWPTGKKSQDIKKLNPLQVSASTFITGKGRQEFLPEQGKENSCHLGTYAVLETQHTPCTVGSWVCKQITM